jgi:hypothetical protein
MRSALETDDLRESAYMQWESEALAASKVTKRVFVLPHRDATCSRRLISPQCPFAPAQTLSKRDLRDRSCYACRR